MYIGRGVFLGTSFLGFHGTVIRKSAFLPPENPQKIRLPDFRKFWARGFLGSKTRKAMVQALNFKKERVVVFTLAYLPKVIGALSDLDPAFFSFLSLNL
jgi:hypothetical protein